MKRGRAWALVLGAALLAGAGRVGGQADRNPGAQTGAGTQPATTQAGQTPTARGKGWVVEWTSREGPQEDAVQVQEEEGGGGGMVVDVRKNRGIGGATLRLKEGQWPKRIVVRLERFGTLDAFGASGAGWRLEGNLQAKGMHTGARKQADGGWEYKPLPAGQAGSIVMEPDKDVIVEVPGLVREGDTRELQIGWIDAYR